MTTWQPHPAPRRSSPLALAFAGAAFVLATWLVLDRNGLFRASPTSTPREVSPRGDLLELEKMTTSVFEATAPSVVHITTEKLARTISGLA
ncbi:MAG: hypothetical protein ABL997_21485, partial [Planctomycetota bacterium]